ncbi:AraC family transcriptional regulator [Paenibacillus sp. TRM 82003]|nr:AraC family transcriptional regulator [Paenibacillus sp. TRM 82003]
MSPQRSAPPASEIEVLSAGFSYHTKPFHTVAPQGFMTNYLVRLQTEGVSRIRVDGELIGIEPGDLVIFAPHMPYELIIEGAEGRSVASGDYWLSFRGTWVDTWWAERRRPTKLKIPLDDHVLSLLRLVVAEHRRMSKESPEMLDYLTRSVCLTIDRLSSEQRPVKGNAFLAYRMKGYIEEHATTLFQLKDIARYCNISVSRAVHLFKDVFDKSIIQYAQEVRLKIARERMLYTQTPLEAIAETSGFPSYTYFYRVFKKEFGMSPKEYRRKNGV